MTPRPDDLSVAACRHAERCDRVGGGPPRARARSRLPVVVRIFERGRWSVMYRMGAR